MNKMFGAPSVANMEAKKSNIDNVRLTAFEFTKLASPATKSVQKLHLKTVKLEVTMGEL